MNAVTVTYATPARDEWDLEGCKHCGAELILNYDGLGTGFSHLYELEPMRNGTKACKPLACPRCAAPTVESGRRCAWREEPLS